MIIIYLNLIYHIKKKLYDVKVIGDSTVPTILYGVDGATAGNSLSSGKVSTANNKSKSIKIKLTQPGSGATEKVDSVGIIYRRLPPTTGNI